MTEDEKHDRYSSAVQAAIIEAGGGADGLVNIEIAVMACMGVAGAMAAMLPDGVRQHVTNYIAKSFRQLVADCHKDMEGKEPIMRITQQ